MVPSAHTHPEGEITGLDKYTQAEVDANIGVVQTDLNNHKSSGNQHMTVAERQSMDVTVANNPPTTDNPFITQDDVIAGAYGLGHTVQEDNVSVPQRLYLNFEGDVALTDNGSDTTTVTVTGAAGTGEENTSSNSGAGAGLAKAKSVYDLPFKSILEGSNINITEQADTITIASTASGGATNLDYTPSVAQGTVTSDTGSDAIIPSVDGSNAGLIIPADKTKIDNLALTYEPLKGSDDNFVTNTEKVIIGNTSNSNSGDNAANTNYANDYRAANFVAGTDYEAADSAIMKEGENISLLNNDSGFTGDQDLSGYAPLASPTFTGTPKAPTPVDNSTPTALATTQYVADNAGGGGSGDMEKATYDTNENGIVDNAALVNNLSVETAVPAGAVFTDNDTVYDDTTIQAEVNLNTAKVTYDDAALVAQHTTDISTNAGNIANKVNSISEETGETVIPNVVHMTGAAYDVITPVTDKLYILTTPAS